MPITIDVQKNDQVQLLNSFLTALTKLNFLLIKSVVFKSQVKLHSRFFCWYPVMRKIGGKEGQKENQQPPKSILQPQPWP